MPPQHLAGQFMEQQDSTRCSEWMLPHPQLYQVPTTCVSENCFSQPTQCIISQDFGTLGSMCLRSGKVPEELTITLRPDGESGPAATSAPMSTPTAPKRDALKPAPKVALNAAPKAPPKVAPKAAPKSTPKTTAAVPLTTKNALRAKAKAAAAKK